jgi:hypothetical protein
MPTQLSAVQLTASQTSELAALTMLTPLGSAPLHGTRNVVNGAAAHLPRSGGHVVAAQLLGGLGNQLFVAAATIAYAHENNASVLLCKPLDSDKRAEATLPLRHSIFARLPTAEYTVEELLAAAASAGVATEFIIQSGGIPNFYSALPPLAWVVSTNSSVVQLLGYFQHAAYFESVGGILRLLFSPPPEIVRRIYDAYPGLTNAVAVHVRRGDFVALSNVLLGIDYYERAVQALLNSLGDGISAPHIFVTSDDLPWVWEQPFFASLRKAGVASAIDEPDALMAMWTLTLVSRGLVCPNSTFCWWAAWLGNAGAQALRPVALPSRWSTGGHPSWAFFVNDTSNL